MNIERLIRADKVKRLIKLIVVLRSRSKLKNRDMERKGK